MAAVPNEFMCPITMVLMKDPVLATDGFTYEKEAIEQWLRSNTKSPMTREPMRLDGLRPNRALRDAIQRWELDKQSSSSKKTRSKEKSPAPSAPSAPASTVSGNPTYLAQTNYGTAGCLLQGHPAAMPQLPSLRHSNIGTGGAGANIRVSLDSAVGGTSIEADHLYAIMIQTQETVEQLKRSVPAPSPAPAPVQRQQQQQTPPLTPEQQRRCAGMACIAVFVVIIMILVLHQIQVNSS